MSLYIRKSEVEILKSLYNLYSHKELPYWGALSKVIDRLERERNKGNEKSKLAMQELYYRRHNK